MTDAVLLYQVQCPLCDESIDLPRQSPLGTFSGLQRQPSRKWPITFLCRERELMCQMEAPQGDPNSVVVGTTIAERQLVLYEIECECAHENCERNVAIYTTDFAVASEDQIVDKLLRGLSTPSPPVRFPSGSHDLELRRDEIYLARLTL